MSHTRDLSDTAAVRAVLDGDRDAFAVLVHRYQDGIYRHVERMTGRPDEAADIVQMAFVKAYRNLDRCRHPERVGAWLFRIAKNQCRDYLKSPRRRDVSLEKIAELPANREAPEETVERTRQLARVEEALQALPHEQREAFVLKHVEGLSYAEMSDLLEASVSALKMRVHRAREELRELLEDDR